jgi:hypothetical protein
MKQTETCQLNLSGFELTIYGRQFSDSHDAWDGNWLNVYCKCQSVGRTAKASGSFLNVGEIADLQSKLARLSNSDLVSERVEIIEPTLDLVLSSTAAKQRLLKVILQPDGKMPTEIFEFNIDKNDLDLAIAQCQTSLRNYPMRGL